MKWENLGNNLFRATMDIESSVNSGKNQMIKVTLDSKIYTVSVDIYEQVKKLLNGQNVVNRTDSLEDGINTDLELARKEQTFRICNANLQSKSVR